MLIDLGCGDFIDKLASDAPAPGGGSASAFVGALASALVSMVASLTAGKEEFKEDEGEINVVLNSAKGLLCELRSYVDEDARAFGCCMDAFKLPKGTEGEKCTRTKAIQKAMEGAADLPLKVAACCLEVLRLADIAVEKGNPNALSDGGVAALLAFAGLRGALFNVDINLGSIKDENIVAVMKAKEQEILKEAEVLHDKIISRVEARLG